MGRTPNKLVFINCPFDSEYRPLFEAIVFAICACGYLPCCALEIIDSGYARLTKIVDLIDLCDFSLHDISRTELNSKNLPRFNMPFELGLALGRKHLKGNSTLSKLLVLDRENWRYLEYLSDLAGRDPASHHNDPHRAIAHVRDWLSSYQTIPLNGPRHFSLWFDGFLQDLPGVCLRWGIDRDAMSFKDLLYTIKFWIEANIPSA